MGLGSIVGMFDRVYLHAGVVGVCYTWVIWGEVGYI